MANSKSGESVIQRVVRILSTFSEESPSFSLRQLAREVELPLTTVHRMVSDLEAEGLVEWDAEGRLRHGYRMWELASRGSRAADLREAALTPMKELLGVVGHHVQLAVLEGNEVLYVERLSAPDTFVSLARIAGRLPVHGCSAGLLFMAYAPEDVQERFLSRRLEKITEHTVTAPPALRRVLAEARKVGFISMEGIIDEASSGISVPIFDAKSRVVAVLSAITPVREERLAVVVPHLKFTARAITVRLGFGEVETTSSS